MTTMTGSWTTFDGGWLPPKDGSHRVESRNGKAVIRDLELFCGYDPDIDDATGDKRIREFDRAKIEDVVKRTSEYMKRGQNPKLVMLHEKDGKETRDDSVGTVLSLKTQMRGGVPFILGDVEMDTVDFDSYLRHNRFARRSAEIWPDGYMSEVALLGRQTPRRPIPDTRFGREGTPEFFERVSDEFAVGIGGGENTFVPSTGKKKKMPNDDNGGEFEKVQEENARLKAELEKLKAEKADVEGKFKSARDEVDRFSDQLVQMRREVRAERFGRDVDAMHRDGFRIDEASRKTMVAELCATATDDDAKAKVDFWRATFRRDPVNVRVDQNGVQIEPGRAPTVDVRREKAATEAAVKELAARKLGPESFKEVFERHLSDKNLVVA